MLADGGEGALAVRFAVVHELIVARARGGRGAVLVRAVRSRLTVRCEGVQVDLLGLLCALVGLPSGYSARDLLELAVALLHVALVAAGASGGFSGLSDDLLCLLGLVAVVSLPGLGLALGQVRVVEHQVFDIAIVRRLVVDALIVALVEADLDLLELL